MSYLFLEAASGLHSVHACAGTGETERFLIPANAQYKLEVWGAEGYGNPQGSGTSMGGLGGYSEGVTSRSSNQSLFVCVGSRPGSDRKGGFNGGGQSLLHGDYIGGGGGGCTSIVSSLIGDGQLKNYESAKTNVIIVAGGGGGSDDIGGDDGTGGAGGGLNGSNAYNSGTLISGTGTYGCGGTQSSGFAFGQGSSSKDAPNDAGGGGGGWYGGYGGNDNAMGGGGGSGYIGGVSKGKTDTGVKVGNGKAIISITKYN